MSDVEIRIPRPDHEELAAAQQLLEHEEPKVRFLAKAMLDLSDRLEATIRQMEAFQKDYVIRPRR